MQARIPLDVDIEDKLLYGLTPTRLAYLVISLLAAFATWSTNWAPSAIRAPSAVVIAALGAAAAWGRWRGRALDGWATDLALFVIANYRIQLRIPRTRWRR